MKITGFALVVLALTLVSKTSAVDLGVNASLDSGATAAVVAMR